MISRGGTGYELDTLFGKLGAHRLSTSHSHLTMIEGKKKKKLGTLDQIDMRKLRDRVSFALAERTSKVGLLITDANRPGLLHKPAGHKRAIKAAMRSSKQLANALN